MTLPPPPDRPQQWSQPAPPGSPWGYGQQAPPTATRKTGTGAILLGALVGVLVSAVIVGGLSLAGVVHWGSASSSAADTRAVDLPDTLGGLTDVAAVSTAKNSSSGAKVGDRYQRTYARSAELYRTAFDGAGVGVRTYSNDQLEFFLTVVGVRADSPGLVNGPQADPADLGVVAQPGVFNLVVDGDVQCLQTSTRAVKEGGQVEDEDLLTSVCRTTAEGLTVYVFGGGGNSGTSGKQQMVELARAARSAIAGS